MAARALNEPLVVEWSEEEKSFHIADLEESLTKNLRAFLDKRPIKYAPLAIVESAEAALEYIEAFEKERPSAATEWLERIQGLNGQTVQIEGHEPLELIQLKHR